VNLRKDHYHNFLKKQTIGGSVLSLLNKEMSNEASCVPRIFITISFSRILLLSGGKEMWKLNTQNKTLIKVIYKLNSKTEFALTGKTRSTDINVNKHFQQRMSWLPQRWRTQWNAIRHAICRIQWVIKTLNATCTSSEVCLLESLFIPTYQSLFGG